MTQIKAQITQALRIAPDGCIVVTLSPGDIVTGALAERVVALGCAIIDKPKQIDLETKPDAPVQTKRRRGRPRKTQA